MMRVCHLSGESTVLTGVPGLRTGEGQGAGSARTCHPRGGLLTVVNLNLALSRADDKKVALGVHRVTALRQLHGADHVL